MRIFSALLSKIGNTENNLTVQKVTGTLYVIHYHYWIDDRAAMKNNHTAHVGCL